MILGLDLSTAFCGICIINEDGKTMLMESIDFNKRVKRKKTDKSQDLLVDKAKVFLDEIQFICSQYPIKLIVIEDFMKGFAFGRTSQQTLILLAQFNGIVQFLIKSHFTVPLEALNVNTARKIVVGAIPKKKDMGGMSQKEFVFEWYRQAIEPNIDYSIKGMKDAVDAFVLAQAALHIFCIEDEPALEM